MGFPFWDAQGFGLGVSVIMDAAKQALVGAGSEGSFGWPGAFGTWWIADPAQEMVLIYLIQNSMPLGPDVRGPAGDRPTAGRPHGAAGVPEDGLRRARRLERIAAHLLDVAAGQRIDRNHADGPSVHGRAHETAVLDRLVAVAFIGGALGRRSYARRTDGDVHLPAAMQALADVFAMFHPAGLDAAADGQLTAAHVQAELGDGRVQGVLGVGGGADQSRRGG